MVLEVQQNFVLKCYFQLMNMFYYFYLKACVSSGYAAAYWNIPMLPESCLDSTLNNKVSIFIILYSYCVFGLSACLHQ